MSDLIQPQRKLLEQKVKQQTPSSVPKPPEKAKVKDQRSFVRLVAKREYLLSGVEEYDNKDNLVEPWREGNVYVLLKPVTAEHSLMYYNSHGETLDKEIALLLGYEFSNYQHYSDPEKFPALEKDEFGGWIVPQVGVLYGDYNLKKLELCAFILSCHGRIIGVDSRNGEYQLYKITEEEIIAVLPPNFPNIPVSEEETVFYEILRISGLFDLESSKEELIKDSELKEDELKNLPKRKGNTKSAVGLSETVNETTE